MTRDEIIKAIKEIEPTSSFSVLDSDVDLKEVLNNLILNGNIARKTINWDKQNRHLEGNIESKDRSILMLDAQVLLDQYYNNGDAKYKNKGIVTKESFTHCEIIGRWFDIGTGKYVNTKRGTIHYSKTGAHIVPSKPIYLKEGERL